MKNRFDQQETGLTHPFFRMSGESKNLEAARRVSFLFPICLGRSKETLLAGYCTGRYELNKLTLLPMCDFITQLVEHRTGIAEVMGSNPIEALIFFRLLLSNCLNWKITLHFRNYDSRFYASRIHD